MPERLWHPDDEIVRIIYMHRSGSYTPEQLAERKAEFDRWLAWHDARLLQSVAEGIQNQAVEIYGGVQQSRS